MNAKLERLFSNSGCEVRYDVLTRQLYATDASIHQIAPQAVAFPRNARQAAAVMRAAADADISITPRGAGTGLAGAAIGHGLIVDFARYNNQIAALDTEKRTVRVGPGVVLDTLNAYLRPYGFCFGPDVATSSRATLGGMIANNSSGARAPVYGTTIDHVESIDLVLADGRTETIGAGRSSLPEIRALVDALTGTHKTEIQKRFHQDLVKRWPGYGVDRYLRSPGDLCKIIAGSEGTLAGITSAVLRIMPPPKKKGLGLIYFNAVDEGMEATVELLDLRPAAIEHIDRVLFDQTKGKSQFQAARDLMGLDTNPSESILMVEFYDDVEDRLAALKKRKLGTRMLICTEPADMEKVWALRKAGVSLLTSRKGSAKPVPGIEDICVLPRQLPEYIRQLEALVKPLGFETSFYGHAASGLVHARPVVDMHNAEDIQKFRQLTADVSALTRAFEGSFAGEHGVGMARTEFMEEQLGPVMMGLMRDIKAAFDPKNQMNPGKLFPDGIHRFDSDLRQGPDKAIPVPFTPMLAYAKRDGSFIDHLEQCNGCGDCRKSPGTMCPTFKATGEECMVTRGRANAIRAALEGRFEGGSVPPITLKALDDALSNCLSCKACQAECPSNVDIALLKAELLHARHAIGGLTLAERLFSRVDWINAIGGLTPRLANTVIAMPTIRWAMEKTIGIAHQRPLPAFARERFDTWFNKHIRPGSAPRGRVILWDDCFVRHNEPHIGIAAVRVLEAAGFEVSLLFGRACCGRPAFSMGRLDVAARMGRRNLDLLARRGGSDPIIFLEPSCYTMFAQDYRELKIDGAEAAAERSVLFEPFLAQLLEREPDALPLHIKGEPQKTAIHAHCHAKALVNTTLLVKLAEKIPGNAVQLLPSSCCGMAGAFGMLAAKYDLSREVGEPLMAMIRALEPGTNLIASGTSCRHQITHFSEVKPLHMAELLADALPS